MFLPVLGHAQVSDHLACYPIKDSLLSGARHPVKSYTADLDGLVPEPGCVIKMPAKYFCVETTKANVQPAPPGAATGPSAGQLLCYKVKCPKATLPAVTVKDQFGTREVTPMGSKLVCAPATTTTTTTSTCPPATAIYCGAADCGAIGSGCPPAPALCPSGMSCTTTGTTCGCTGESIPCGDPRLSGLTCNFCKWGTCPPGMTCGGVPKQGACGFDCACH